MDREQRKPNNMQQEDLILETNPIKTSRGTSNDAKQKLPSISSLKTHATKEKYSRSIDITSHTTIVFVRVMRHCNS